MGQTASNRLTNWTQLLTEIPAKVGASIVLLTYLRIMHNLHIEHIPVDALRLYENNSRTHSDSQVEAIARSIQQFGFVNPVLIDAKGIVIAGHGRISAAKSIGMQIIPCIRLEHLTDEQRRALTIADNKIPLTAGWDLEKLTAELHVLASMDFDMDALGFSDQELDGLLKIDQAIIPHDVFVEHRAEVPQQQAPPTEFKSYDDDDVEPRPLRREPRVCPHCGEPLEA